MALQSDLLNFESDAFPIVVGEDRETNPGIFGRSLAEWLSEQLRNKGLLAGDVFAEDFGWCFSVKSSPHQLYVVCGNLEETTNQWRVFAFAEGGLLARLFGTDRRAETLAELFKAIKMCLKENPDVHCLEQETEV